MRSMKSSEEEGILLNINSTVYKIRQGDKERIMSELEEESDVKTESVWFEGTTLCHQFERDDGESETTEVDIVEVFSCATDFAENELDQLGIEPLINAENEEVLADWR